MKFFRTADGDKMEIRTFGGLTVYNNGTPVNISWESQKARLLFCYLLITYDQWVHRDKLTEILWPGCDMVAGAKNFKTTLSRLRKSFYGAECINPVLTQGEAIRINYDVITADCSAFKKEALTGLRLTTRGDLSAARQSLERAQDHYTGDFLPEEPFDTFITTARNEFRELNGSILTVLEKIYATEERTDAVEALMTLKKIPFTQPA
jgi:SARP family transcriptional regulator, regulator of embCAB operon